MASLKVENGVLQLSFGDMQPLGHEIVAIAADRSLASYQSRELIGVEVGKLSMAVKMLVHDGACDAAPQVSRINDHFEAMNPRGTKGMPVPGESRSNVLGWLARASSRELKSFSIWNVDRHAQQQAALRRVAPKLRDSTMDRARTLIGLDVLPKQAIAFFDAATKQPDTLVALDVFEVGGHDALGLTTMDGTNIIGLANLFMNPSRFTGLDELLYGTAFHEYKHLAGVLACAGYWPMESLEETVVRNAEMASSDLEQETDPLSLEPRLDEDPGIPKAMRELIQVVTCEGAPSPIHVTEMGVGFYDVTKNKRVKAYVLSRLNRNIQVLIPEYKLTGHSGLERDLQQLKGNDLAAEYLQGITCIARMSLGHEPHPKKQALVAALIETARTIKRNLDAGVIQREPLAAAHP